MTAQPLIVSNPAVMFGKPVIRGTRITVELILEHLAAGRSPQELLEFYPHLTLPAILAAVEFAGKSLRNDSFYPVGQHEHEMAL